MWWNGRGAGRRHYMHTYLVYLVVIMARAEGTLEGDGATTSPAIHPFVRPLNGDDIRDPLSNAEPCPTPPPFSWSRHLHQYVRAQRAMTSVGQLCLRCLETVELHLAVAWRGVPTRASKLAGPLHRGVAARRAVLPLQQTSCSSHPPSLRLVFLGWLLFFHHSRTHTHSHALTRTHTHITHITHPPPLSRRLTPGGARTHRLIVSSSTLFSVVIPTARSAIFPPPGLISLRWLVFSSNPVQIHASTHTHTHNRDEVHRRKQRKTAVVKYTIPV